MSATHRTHMKVLVLGGRGTLGKLVVSELTARGHTAVPLGRRDDLAAQDGDAIVNCAGASVAMALGHGWRGYRAVDTPLGLAAVAAAKRMNARLVYVAAHHTPALRDYAYIDAHERVALAMRGLDGVVVRATGFFAVFADLVAMARRGFLVDIGKGTARTNPIAEQDLAAIVAQATVGGDGPRELSAGGPEILTRKALFELIAASARRRVRMMRVPLWLARAGTFALRPLHPRIAQFAQFACGLARHDSIAPQLGTMKLADYLAGGVTDRALAS